MTKMRQWSILTAVAVLVVFAAGWFLLVKPQGSKASDLRSQATTQENANQLLISQISQLQAEERSLPQQQAALRKFSTQVPDNASEPTIIRQLSAAANGAGVDLVSMTPGSASPVVAAASSTGATVPAAGSTSLTSPAAGAGQLVQLPIAIGVTGTFPNMESFFQSLEKLPRAMLVTGWSMCPATPATTGSASTSTAGANCTPPSLPAGKVLPDGTLGGTLNATIFYSPAAGTVAPTGTTSLTAPATTATTTTTTTPATTTATTPAPTTSTAATPATGATTAPAN